MTGSHIISCLMLVASCLTAIPVWADDAKKGHVLETVTVTAQKQEENVQDVPMSISVFNGQQIEDAGIDSLLDVADHVPNFMLFSNGVDGFNSPSMRGMHGFVETMTSSTGLFVDGVPVLSAVGFDDVLLDVERVEVLRGPQGTLYGKNTEAGAINIITRQPDNTFRGSVTGGMGEDYKKETAMHLSGPIFEDKLFFSVAGLYYEKDGFIKHTLDDSTFNDKQHAYGRGQLRWTPTDDLDISFTASRMEYDDTGNDMNLAPLGATTFGVATEDRKIASNVTGTTEPTTTALSLKITYDFLESLQLTSITTNRVYHDVTKNMDYDFSPLTLMHSTKDSEYSKFSQELRLDSATEDMNWLIGVYYDRDNNDIWTQVDSVIPAMAKINDRNFEGQAYALFGQVTYPFLDRFRLIGGLRYEVQQSSFTDHIANVDYDHTWEDISPKASIEFDVTDDIMTYVTVSKGFRSGGFNTYATNPKYARYDAEEIWSYELGCKSTLLDNRLIFNGAAYYMNIDNMQVNEAINPAEAYLTNAAKATAIGFEADVTAMITEELSLMGGYGFSDITFDEFEDTLGNYKGNMAPYAPKYNFNVGAQYRNQNGIFARADLIGYGKMYFGKENKYSRDAYEIVNAKIGYELDNFDIYLYGKNVFDQKYDSVGMFDGFYTVYSKPREVGLTLAYRF